MEFTVKKIIHKKINNQLNGSSEKTIIIKIKRKKMKKIATLFVLFYLSFSIIYAQTTELEKTLRKQNIDTTKSSTWETGGVISLNLSQVSLKNWSAGGENSLSWSGLVNVFLNYKNKNISWDNTLDIGYGSIKKGESENFIKSDDKIDLSSKYGQKILNNLYFSGLLNLKTQITAGYKLPNDSTKISNFLAPGYLLGAIGMDYKLNSKFSCYLSPITTKITIVNDQTLANSGAFGVKPAEYDTTNNIIKEGKRTRSEFGGYLKIHFKHNIMKNISFQTKLDLFSNYLNNPTNIDINWETLLAMKINKFFTANIATNLLYDDDITIKEDTNGDDIVDKSGPRTQFKEVFGIGISYKF